VIGRRRRRAEPPPPAEATLVVTVGSDEPETFYLDAAGEAVARGTVSLAEEDEWSEMRSSVGWRVDAYAESTPLGPPRVVATLRRMGKAETMYLTPGDTGTFTYHVDFSLIGGTAGRRTARVELRYPREEL
jgi:hypothetical protein